MRVHSCLYICLPTGQNHRATELEMNQFKFSTKASSNQLLTWTLHNSQFVEQKMHMKCHQYYLFIIHIFFLLPLIPSFPFGYNLYHNTTQISSRQSCVIEKTHTMNGNCIVTNHWLHDFFHSRIHGFYWNGSGYLQMLLLLVLFGIYIYHIYIYWTILSMAHKHAHSLFVSDIRYKWVVCVQKMQKPKQTGSNCAIHCRWICLLNIR